MVISLVNKDFGDFLVKDFLTTLNELLTEVLELISHVIFEVGHSIISISSTQSFVRDTFLFHWFDDISLPVKVAFGTMIAAATIARIRATIMD